MKSIISDEKKCYKCGTTINLHSHHIFEGRNRKNSEKYGLKVWLCGRHHNLSKEGVHFNKEFDLELKKIAQKKFKKVYKEEFIDILEEIIYS